MKRIITLALMFVIIFEVMAQDINMTIVDGIQNNAVKNRMERGISLLLTEINQACAQERPLRLDGIDMALSGKRSLQALWKNLHFLMTPSGSACQCDRSRCTPCWGC